MPGNVRSVLLGKILSRRTVHFGCLVMLALGGCFALGSQVAGARFITVPAGRYFAFHTYGTNGYVISVVTDGRHHIVVDVSGQGGHVVYRAPAHVTADGITARIGHI